MKIYRTLRVRQISLKNHRLFVSIMLNALCNYFYAKKLSRGESFLRKTNVQTWHRVKSKVWTPGCHRWILHLRFDGNTCNLKDKRFLRIPNGNIDNATWNSIKLSSSKKLANLTGYHMDIKVEKLIRRCQWNSKLLQRKHNFETQTNEKKKLAEVVTFSGRSCFSFVKIYFPARYLVLHAKSTLFMLTLLQIKLTLSQTKVTLCESNSACEWFKLYHFTPCSSVTKKFLFINYTPREKYFGWSLGS